MDFSNKEKNQMLGQFLQEQRMQKNISLEEIANRTGVPIQHLKNVENGMFERYDQFYLKMYIKKYSGIVNLNVDEIYQRFYGEEIKKSVEVKVKKEKTKKINLVMVRSVLAVAVVLVAGTGIYAMVNQPNEVKEKPEVVIKNPNSQNLIDKVDDSKENEEIEKQPPVVPDKPKTVVSLVSQQNQEANFDVISKSNEIEVSLSFLGDCWLDGKLNSETLIPGTVFKNEESHIFKVTPEMLNNTQGTLLLNVGNVTMVTLSVDNEIVQIDTQIPHQYVALNFIFE